MTAQRTRVTILCYHDPSPQVMDKHLSWLLRHYNIISLKRYVDFRTNQLSEALPGNALVLTFDDGHKGNYHLKEVLVRRAAPATIFLCSSIVGTNRQYWWTVLRDRKDNLALKRVPDSQRLHVLRMHGFDETKGHESRQGMSREEIVELRSTVDFQCHTRFHPILPQCSREKAEDEIVDSKTELEKEFGLEIYALAYPNGNYSYREIEILKKASYRCALTLEGGYNGKESDLFCLKRIPVYDQADVNELIVKTSGLWDMLGRVIYRKSYQYLTTPSQSGAHQ